MPHTFLKKKLGLGDIGSFWKWDGLGLASGRYCSRLRIDRDRSMAFSLAFYIVRETAAI